MYVIGADGCRNGWISAATAGGSVTFQFHPSLYDLITTNPDSPHITVDIPIGLMQDEPRRCDIEARKLLGARKSSVFPTPDRRVLEAFVQGNLSYPESNALSKTLTGKGVSTQAYNIFAKIAEADALITPELQSRISEVHPELSFLALAGHPMRHSKKRSEGFSERLGLLTERFPEFPVGSRADARKIAPFAQPDDVLDATAAAATALRIVRGEASRIPTTAQTDARGLRVEICY